MSLPPAFIQHYTTLLGHEKASLFFEYCTKPLRKSIRINTLKETKEHFLHIAKQHNWKLSPVLWCDTGFFIERQNDAIAIGNTLTHALGGIYVQEASSMIPVEALFWGQTNQDFSGKIIADIAASPGSKTTHIACKLQGKGTIVANELSASRLKALYSNLERCGVANSILTHYDGENLCQLLPQTFDLLLLDAPCTGEGTVRKNYDALKNWTPDDAKRMSVLQKKLIVSAFSALKYGGEMVYSTCTLGREENQEVVAYLQEHFPEDAEIVPLNGLFEGYEKAITPEGFLHVFPEIYNTEGFFVAKIRKKQRQTDEKHLPPLKNFPFSPLPFKEEQTIRNHFLHYWGCILPVHLKIWKRDNEYWLFPESIEKIANRVRCNRSGICLGEQHGKKWKTSFEAISAYGKDFTKHCIEISSEQVSEVFAGKNIETHHPNNEEILLRWQTMSVAVGKTMNGIWKNALPRVLIRNIL